VEADVLGYKNGAILEARVELWSAKGMIAATTAPVGGNARLTVNLAGGKYYAKVMSGGGLTDVGQYTLTVNRPSEFSIVQVSSTMLFTTKGLTGGLTADATPAFATLTTDVAKFVTMDTATLESPSSAGPRELPPNLDALAVSVGLSQPDRQATQADLDALAALVNEESVTMLPPAEVAVATSPPDVPVPSDPEPVQPVTDVTLIVSIPDPGQVATAVEVVAADPVDGPASPISLDIPPAEFAGVVPPATDSSQLDASQAQPTAALDALLAASDPSVVDTSAPPSTIALDAVFADADASVLDRVYLV
jgi:hypothetical protein